MNSTIFKKIGSIATAAHFLLSAPSLAAAVENHRAKTQSPPPNVLLIIADDLNDAISRLGGHPQAKTPNIDRLMARGVSFTHAYSNAPLCAPSRASLLSGYQPHTSNFYSPHQPGGGRFDWRDNPMLKNSRTIMEHFTANDYIVCGTGKIFHNDQEDWKVWFGRDGVNRFGVRPSWGPWPWNGKNPRPGWGGASSHPGETFPLGIDGNFASLAEIPKTAPDPKKGIPGYEGWRLYQAPFRYQSETDRDLMPDERNAQWVDQQLKTSFNHPFLMMVGLNRPHAPLYAPQKYFDRFPLDEIQLAASMPGDLDDTAKIFRNDSTQSSTGLHGFERYHDIIAAGGEQLLRKWTQAYLANVAFVDDIVGQILDSLERSEYAGNTIILFTSDNGYHMGQKETVFKNTLWEESTRIPLIVSGPRIAENQTCSAPVSLIDIFPTLNDYAGLPDNPNLSTHATPLDGHSLRRLLEDPVNGKWNGPDYAVSSVGIDQLDPKGNPAPAARSHYTIRTRSYRYILYNNDEEELYNCESDPHEWTNLASDPAFARTKAALKVILVDIRSGTKEDRSEKSRAEISR